VTASAGNRSRNSVDFQNVRTCEPTNRSAAVVWPQEVCHTGVGNGDEGYSGSVLAPTLRTSGHDVLGLGTGFFAGCAVAPVDRVAGLRRDLRDVTPCRCRRV
jgi:hypothetical protein